MINPGNPTSSVLTKDEIKEIIKFAHRHRLFLMADEVYQHNVWADGAEFVSFKKVGLNILNLCYSIRSIRLRYTEERENYSEFVITSKRGLNKKNLEIIIGIINLSGP